MKLRKVTPAIRDALILTVLVAGGALLRLPYLFGGLWRDEASTYFEIVPRTIAATLAAVARGELNPPAFFLLEREWSVAAGYSDVALKIPSFLSGVGLILMTYFVGRIAWTRDTALLAAGFACVTPAALDLSGEARPYALAALLAAVTVWCYLKAASVSRLWPAAVGLVVAGAALAYTHYTGIVLLALLAVATPYVLWQGHRLERLGIFALAFAAIALLYAPWIPTMRVHIATGAPWTIPIPRSAAFDAARENIGFLLPIITAHSTVILALMAGLVIAGVMLGVRLARGDRAAIPDGPTVALAVCTIGGAISAALLSEREPRYMFVFAPGAWVWFAALLLGLERWITGLKVPAARFSAIGVVFVGLLLLGVGEVRGRLRAPPVIASSGIHELAPQALVLAQKGHTLLLVAPDYLGPTVAYYIGVPSRTAVNGFVRWDNPEAFSPQGYAALWEAPDALTATQQRIRFAAESGATTLLVIRDQDIEDRGAMRFGRTAALVSWLQKSYSLIQSAHYPGRKEGVNVDTYSLSPGR